MLPHARHDWLVLADSDISVAPDYLEQVTAPLARSGRLGIVTCLYRGIARQGIWAKMGRLFIDDWFAPSVRLAHAFGSTRFAFGSTIALRRDTLQAIGGFEALRDTLADDFWLGELSRQRGLRTVLSDDGGRHGSQRNAACPRCGRTSCAGCVRYARSPRWALP
jgi:ceramide glucosyltransferase